MKNLILITSSFPYGKGEQFLETEIKYYKDIKVTILPKVKQGKKRSVGDTIVNDFLANKSMNKNKVKCLFKAFKSKVFFQELFSESFLNLKKMKILFSSLYQYQMYYELFDDYFFKVKDLENTIIYTYWNDEVTYALQSLKDKYKYKLISRIHGGDLYKERKAFGYMPLKQHFTHNIDTLYTITESANIYLADTYGFSKDTLKLSRLGVEDRSIITRYSKENSLNILSCSFLNEIKRVDKIIKSLKIIATQLKEINFRWTHIGDGVLYNQIVTQAEEELDNLSNVNYNFVGNYKNEQVYEFYLRNEIDVFVNVSESEGVPVSIMEAMSCHIPIIAPDVGGVKDMVVDGYNGFLLSKECCVDELVESLRNISFFKNSEIRDHSYEIFVEKYDAKKNYKNFINEIMSYEILKKL